jgi:lipid A 3-O-deacylase PagL
MAMASMMGLAIPCAAPAAESVGTAQAVSSSGGAASEAGEWWLLLGAAAVGIFDPDPKAMASVESRYTSGRHRPGPWLALEATERDLFIGFGAFVDLPMGQRWVFTPSLGAAIYQEHDGLGLGYHLEYRSAAELTCRIERWRWGTSFSHYSNASLGEDNSGTEILKILFVVPVGRSGLQ